MGGNGPVASTSNGGPNKRKSTSSIHTKRGLEDFKIKKKQNNNNNSINNNHSDGPSGGVELAAMKILQEQQHLQQQQHRPSRSVGDSLDLSLRQTLSNISAAAAGARSCQAATSSSSSSPMSISSRTQPGVSLPQGHNASNSDLAHAASSGPAITLSGPPSSPSFSAAASNSSSLLMNIVGIDAKLQQQPLPSQPPILPQGSPFTQIQQQPQFQKHHQMLQHALLYN